MPISTYAETFSSPMPDPGITRVLSPAIVSPAAAYTGQLWPRSNAGLGATGPTGPTGASGSAGGTGATGATGASGASAGVHSYVLMGA